MFPLHLFVLAKTTVQPFSFPTPNVSLSHLSSALFVFVGLLYFKFCCPNYTHCSPIEDAERPSRVNRRNKQNRFIPLSEGVTACAAHPLNGTIIAGTQVCSFGSSPLTVLFYAFQKITVGLFYMAFIGNFSHHHYISYILILKIIGFSFHLCWLYPNRSILKSIRRDKRSEMENIFTLLGELKNLSSLYCSFFFPGVIVTFLS